MRAPAAACGWWPVRPRPRLHAARPVRPCHSPAGFWRFCATTLVSKTGLIFSTLGRDRRDERRHRHVDQDQRADGPQRGPDIVGARAEVGGEMQQARQHVAVQRDAGERQRRRGEQVQKTGDQEERQVLQVVELDLADPVDAVVGLQLARVGCGIQRRLSQVFRRAESPPWPASCARRSARTWRPPSGSSPMRR